MLTEDYISKLADVENLYQKMTFLGEKENYKWGWIQGYLYHRKHPEQPVPVKPEDEKPKKLFNPVKQTIFHNDPNGLMGNCLQAAIASVLGKSINAVPHFAAIEDNSWFDEMIDYLNKYGFNIQDCDTADISTVKGSYVLVIGKSPREVSHVVIYQNGEMVHDPHPSNSGLETIEWSAVLTPSFLPPAPVKAVTKVQLSNIQDQHGIDSTWLKIWEQIEAWYGDPKKKESGRDFLLRMQREFSTQNQAVEGETITGVAVNIPIGYLHRVVKDAIIHGHQHGMFKIDVAADFILNKLTLPK